MASRANRLESAGEREEASVKWKAVDILRQTVEWWMRGMRCRVRIARR